ncbi:UNVERIFIED_CONTAM: hypothetical protein LK11_38105 [Mumia flava]|nr:DUF6801 domain-containing protein [Mumia flava]
MLSREAGSRSRLAALATSAALVAGAGGLVVASAPAASAAPVEEDYDYTCAVDAAGLSLGDHIVGVNAKVVVPDAVAPNQVVPPRKTQITLTLPETLRNATYVLLSGRTAGGYSDDAAVRLTDSGSVDKTIPIKNLSSPPVPVPASPGASWVIPTEGDVPAIRIPASATGTGTLSMPAQFTVKATVYTANGEPVGGPDKVVMDCSFGGDATLATMPITGAAYVDAALSGSGKVVYGKPGRINARINKAVGGRIDAYYGSRKIGSAPVKGTAAAIALKARSLAPGKRAVTLKHVGGQANLNPVANKRVTVTVVKGSSALAAKVAPKKIKRNKTKAKAVVVVKANGSKAGVVTAKLGKKTIGKARVKGSKATLKLKKFKKAGKAKITFVYSGNKYFKGSKKTVKVKIRR